MLRVSTTTLEAYRRLVQTDFGTDAELADQVMGKPWTPTWQMNAGTAWHKVLETSAGGWSGGDFVREGHFSFGPMKAINEAIHHIGPGVWEVKATHVFELDWLKVNVVAKADHVRGLVIQDNKAKFSQADARDYEAALQWRFYLLCHGAQCVRYNLFPFKEPAQNSDLYTLKEIISFRFWAYPELECDCLAWVSRFVNWADAKGLLPYLEREGTSIGVEHAA